MPLLITPKHFSATMRTLRTIAGSHLKLEEKAFKRVSFITNIYLLFLIESMNISQKENAQLSPIFYFKL